MGFATACPAMSGGDTAVIISFPKKSKENISSIKKSLRIPPPFSLAPLLLNVQIEIDFQ